MFPPWHAITPSASVVVISAVIRHEQFFRFTTEDSGMRTCARV